MIYKIEEEYYFSSASEFVKKFNLFKKFKTYFNKSLNTWNEETFIDDKSIIESLLNSLEGRYLVYYDELTDGFKVFKILFPT